jgi:hypothetical protein
MQASITTQKNGMVIAVLDAEAARVIVRVRDFRGTHP